MNKDSNAGKENFQENVDDCRCWPEEDYPIEKYPVWSILVLCYKNRALLDGMLKSIFSQDYPRIRLIVSDDGSADFDVEAVKEFIEENKEANIVEYRVQKNAKNMKTVPHISKCLEDSGEYFVFTAADDRFVRNDAITKYNRAFAANPEAVWLVAKCNVVTPDYQRSIYITPTVEDDPFFVSGDAKSLFSRWSRRGMAVPCSMAFKRAALEAVGGIDPSYTYLEDWPLELKLCRNGYAPIYLPYITAAHSSGGVTNSNETYGVEVRRSFYDDKQRLFQQEVEPYMDMLAPEDREAYRIYQHEIFDRSYFFNIEWEGAPRFKKLKLALSSWQHFWWIVEQQYMKRCADLDRKKLLLASQFLLLISYFMLSPGNTWSLSSFFKIVGAIDFIAALFIVVFAVASVPVEIMCKRKAELRQQLVN
ncbi:MAG: glycosyltransferase [Eubacteriales bacterium]|nr:glycosyltransferase [Eubacteriales bacterium]